MDDPHFLTTEEAARLLNVHQNTTVRWIKSGRLPSSKIGREYRIPREAIANRVDRAAPGTRTIAVANQKGGVAKTTTTLNLAAGLAGRASAYSDENVHEFRGCRPPVKAKRRWHKHYTIKRSAWARQNQPCAVTLL